MSAPGSVLVWICAALAALPLAPCAFFASGCRGDEQQAAVEAEPVPAESCCAHNEQPADEPTEPEQETCQGECCRISPFVPSAGKQMPAMLPAATFAALPLVDDSLSGGISSPAILVSRTLSLNVLHCQWRC